MTDGADQMGLAGSRVADCDEIGTGFEPVPGSERLDVRLGECRYGLELECCQCLSARQSRLSQMACDAPFFPFGQFDVGQGGQQAGCGPFLGIAVESLNNPTDIGSDFPD